MTIYLHAGTPKTGTTALQGFLEANRDLLAEAGYRLPTFTKKPNHMELAAYALKADKMVPIKLTMRLGTVEAVRRFKKRFAKRFAQSVDATGDYIFTSEHCSGFLQRPNELEALKKLLTSTGQEVRVILYFREPADYLAASFSTNVRNGETPRLNLPSAYAYETKYNYLKICRLWARVFGKDAITPRLFIRDQMEGGLIEHDFCKLLGLPESFMAKARFSESASNVSLEPRVLSFLLAVNEQVPRIRDGAINPLRDDLGAVCEAISSGQKVLVPERVRAAIYNSLIEDFATWNERFLGGSFEWPFPLYKDAGKHPLEPLTAEEIREIGSLIFQEKARQLRESQELSDQTNVAAAATWPSPHLEGAGKTAEGQDAEALKADFAQAWQSLIKQVRDQRRSKAS
ncbi:MAG: hypothetical protein AAFY02_07070 [Pseudomonadota bacterium]